jgi:decaprenylphospho-beta-D-ribofuranose 2-oxidase
VTVRVETLPATATMPLVSGNAARRAGSGFVENHVDQECGGILSASFPRRQGVVDNRSMPTERRVRRHLTGWGLTVPSVAEIVTPRTPEDAAAALARVDRRGVIARGLGRSYGDLAQNGGGLVIDMTALNRVHSFDTARGTITVEAGCTIGQLIATTLPHGWFVPVVPGTRHVTVGGAIACDIHGKNHHRDGSFGLHVVNLILLTSDGATCRLDPAGSPEEFWATVGGLGLTGVILQATLQLIPVYAAAISVDIKRTTNLDDTFRALREGDHRYRYSVGWVDGLAKGRAFGRSVLMGGNHSGQNDPRAATVRPSLASHHFSVPGWFSTAPLFRRGLIAAYNEFHFRRTREVHDAIRPFGSFFFPLDGIGNWNRLFGAGGFLQYQFVVPYEREDVVAAALERLAGRDVRPTLAVLKRLGSSRGLLSFPVPGWTLAIDLALPSPGLGRVLDDLDGLVGAAGGRVYLAKDSRLSPEHMTRMYPSLEKWQAVRARLDPEERMQCDLARRLLLVPSS